MGLFRVLSLLPKKGPICFSLLPTIHINMYSAYSLCLHFSIDSPPFSFFLCRLLLWFQPLIKHIAPEPLSHPENETEKHNTGVSLVWREPKKSAIYSAWLLLQGLLWLARQRTASHGADGACCLGRARREQRWSTCTVALWGPAKSELCGFQMTQAPQL